MLVCARGHALRLGVIDTLFHLLLIIAIVILLVGTLRSCVSVQATQFQGVVWQSGDINRYLFPPGKVLPICVTQ